MGFIMKEEFIKFEKDIINVIQTNGYLLPISLKSTLEKIEYDEVLDYIKQCDLIYRVAIFFMDERFQTTNALRDYRQVYKNGFFGKNEYLGLLAELLFNRAKWQGQGFFAEIDIKDDEIIEELKKDFKDSLEDIYIFLDEKDQTDELFQKALSMSNDTEIVTIWENTKNQAPIKLNILFDVLNTKDNIDYRILFEIWRCTRIKSNDLLNLITTSDKYEALVQSFGGECNFINALFNHTPVDNKIMLEQLLTKYFERLSNDNTPDQIEKMKEKLYALISIDKNVTIKLYLRILDEKYNFLNLEQLVVLCSDRLFQERIVDANMDIDDQLFKRIFTRICNNNSNWARDISKYLYVSHFDYNDIIKQSYGSLLHNISRCQDQHDIDEIIDRYIKVASRDPMNYFDIKTIEDLFKYSEIKRKMCIQLLNGEDIEDFNIFNSTGKIYIRKQDRKKFAFFELKWGISLDDAKNLVIKYGKDINLLSGEKQEEKDAIELIKEFARIIESDEEHLDVSNLEENSLDIAEIEDVLRKMYLKTFQQQLDSTSPTRVYHIKYDGDRKDLQGKDVLVEEYSPIDENGDFKYTRIALVIRKEGAFTRWTEPTNYNDYFNTGSLYKRKFYKFYNA